MNWYLVQYADSNGMVYQWAQSSSHLDAASDVLIDRGFDKMLHTNDDTMITVVRKDDYVAGNYTRDEVLKCANVSLGLDTGTLDDDPDWWRE
tara:strand:- start:186 stop:461 length:276 start_codon:yes stop_codon:yes gene_type:complete